MISAIVALARRLRRRKTSRNYTYDPNPFFDDCEKKAHRWV